MAASSGSEEQFKCFECGAYGFGVLPFAECVRTNDDECGREAKACKACNDIVCATQYDRVYRCDEHRYKPWNFSDIFSKSGFNDGEDDNNYSQAVAEELTKLGFSTVCSQWGCHNDGIWQIYGPTEGVSASVYGESDEVPAAVKANKIYDYDDDPEVISLPSELMKQIDAICASVDIGGYYQGGAGKA